jgi:hypothetical protein
MSGSKHRRKGARAERRWTYTLAVTDAQKAAKHREIRQRYKRKWTDDSFRNLRANEIRLLIEDNYGDGDCLPNNEQGREYAIVAMHHLPARERQQQWLDQFAPWMSEPERNRMIEKVEARSRRRYRADTLGSKFEVSNQQRNRLGIRTIGAFDFPKAARKGRRKEEARARSERHRRAKGARPWAKYVAASLTKLKPWKAERISRATWYRRRKTSETG